MKPPKRVRDRILSEFGGVDLGDERRNARLMQVVEGLARDPRESFPTAMGSAAGLEGAYRLLNNAQVEFDELHEDHAEQTSSRCVQAGQVLVLHDTTAFEFRHGDPELIGYTSTGKAGFLGHVSLALDRRQPLRPLGVLAVETLVRKQRSGRGSRALKASAKEMAAWKNKESARWARGVRITAERLDGCANVLHVMDSEGDAYELLSEMTNSQHRFVTRARYDRKAKAADANAEWSHLNEVLAQELGRAERPVQLSRRRGTLAKGLRRSKHVARDARVAQLRFSATAVELHRPKYADKSHPKTLRVHAVRVWEPSPPEDQTGVEWLLLTSEPIGTVEEILAVVDAYRHRWIIEEYFKALKTGCIYESRQFESLHALLNLLAIFLPIAVELLWLRSRARESPNAPATDALTRRQLDVLIAMGPRKLPRTPSIEQAFLSIAEMGGHWASNGPPGWLILRRGYEKLLAYEAGWAARGRRKM